MKTIACVALLITVSLQAQDVPSTRETAPSPRESAPQNQAQPPAERTTVLEFSVSADETRRILDDLGYNFNFRQPVVKSFPPSRCAIPLMTVPVPDKNFAMKTSPANPSIDPKIVLAPAVPACPQS